MTHPWFLKRTLKLLRGCTSWPRSSGPVRLSQVLWALVVDAASCDGCAMCESLLAAVMQDDDAEFEKAANPYDQDSLLERAFMMGWKLRGGSTRHRRIGGGSDGSN